MLGNYTSRSRRVHRYLKTQFRKRASTSSRIERFLCTGDWCISLKIIDIMYRALKKIRHTHECQFWIQFVLYPSKMLHVTYSSRMYTTEYINARIITRFSPAGIQQTMWLPRTSSSHVCRDSCKSVQVLRYTGHTIYYYVSLCISTPSHVLISMSCSHCNMTTGDTPIVSYSLQQLLYWRT